MEEKYHGEDPRRSYFGDIQQAFLLTCIRWTRRGTQELDCNDKAFKNRWQRLTISNRSVFFVRFTADGGFLRIRKIFNSQLFCQIFDRTCIMQPESAWFSRLLDLILTVFTRNVLFVSCSKYFVQWELHLKWKFLLPSLYPSTFFSLLFRLTIYKRWKPKVLKSITTSVVVELVLRESRLESGDHNNKIKTRGNLQKNKMNVMYSF